MLMPKIYPVTCHTDHVGPGSTFVAIKGYATDGTKYINDALAKGATTIVLDQASSTPELEDLCKQFQAGYSVVRDTRIALAEQAAQALGNPADKLKIIGITGTKGKTTTAYLTEYLLRQAGHKTALVSTIAQTIGDQREDSKLTTPESDYLQMFFAQCVKAGVEYVVMEVSSHALALNRVHGIEFTSVGFSNLSQDHLDFHGDLESYFAAKTQLFSMVKAGGSIVINSDSEWGKRAAECAAAHSKGASIISYGQEPMSANHEHLQILETSFSGITIKLGSQTYFCPSLFGSFNGYNIAMAILLCSDAKINAAQALAQFPGVPGRLQKHTLKSGAHAFVDYAHNTPSFHAVLSMLRPYTKHLIVIFGCGGNKPKERRFGMGRVAAEFADTIIVTDDNPRFEDRNAIINDIISGMPEEKQKAVVRQADRAQAIALAASLAHEGSIVALLGKGHETYYLINGQTLYFDDYEEIRKF